MDRDRLTPLIEAERERFASQHPGSRALFEEARGNLLAGVPMSWMARWPGGHPIFAAEASGARITDVDGIDYVDLCLGDTGAMAGHAPAPTAEAVAERYAQGSTLMLPTEDSIWVAGELARRFGLPKWQLTLSATDANRFAIRMARQITGRRRILVFSYCYHGTVDESFIVVGPGRPPGLEGGQCRPSGRSDGDHLGGRVQRRRGARAGPAGGGDRLRDDRAGAHQHRDRPAGAGFPRRPSQAHPGHRAPSS